MFNIRRPGDGPPTVFIHGASQSCAFWEPMLDALAEQGMAGVAPDLPGFGQSASEPGPYTLPEFAAAVAQLIDSIGGSAMVVANSMGASVAQLLALDYPSKVSRLLLAAAGPYFPNAEQAATRWGPQMLASWPERDVEASVRRFFQRPDEQSNIQRFYTDARLASAQAAVESMQSNIALNTLDRLHRITVPTLIVQGRHDPGRTVAHGQMMAERIANARLEVLERSGHTPHLDEPEAFAALALPFLLAGRAIHE